jgi:FAD/FMN-containing dehydrogenase
MEMVNELKSKIRGNILLADSPGYDETRSIWNGMIEKRPTIIVRCLGVIDVINCVNFAREQGLKLSIKGGGHNISGLAVCDDGLMLDMSLMRGVWVDPDKRIAHAQAGCLLGDVDRETQLHGLAAVLGFVSETGIAGLTLGGGFGYLTKKYGWTSDTVLSMQVVAADGRLLRASEDENSDLFWALRGGGGNFGVVTDFEYKLFPVGPQIVAGAIAWPAEYSKEVFELFHSITENAPPELTCVAGLRIAPPAPWLVKDIHGKPIVALFVCHSGEVAEGEKLVAPLKALGSPVGDILQKRPYVAQQSLLDATQPKGRRYYWKSEYLPKLDPQALIVASEHAKNIVSPHSAILFFPLHGALNNLPEEHSPVGNRDAAWVVNVSSSWEQAADDQTNIDWTRKAWQDMLQFSTGGTYINFLTEDEGDERIRNAYGKNYDRLIGAKTKWDPKNLFRINKNIAPQV